MGDPRPDAFLAAVATALSRRLVRSGLGPLRVEGTGPGAEAAAAALAALAATCPPDDPATGGPPADPGAPGQRPKGAADPVAVLVVGPGAARDGCVEEVATGTGLRVSFKGTAVASPAGVPDGEGIPFALLDAFDPAAVGEAPDDFDVLAVVTTFNEADIAGGLLDGLVAGSVRVHVVDNWSTDGTFELVEERSASSKGRITCERFPRAHPSPYFELETLLRRVEDVAASSGADWVVHHDADEIREAPWRGIGLRRALYALDRWGFTVADHTVANFVATDDAWRAGGELAGHFTRLRFGDAPGHFLQEKAWRQPGEASGGAVEIASSGGHEAVLPGKRVFPYKFLTRHYPIRSQAHGERKIIGERRARFSPAERRRGWHAHYDALGDAPRFVARTTEGLARVGDLDGPLLLQRLTGAGLPGNPYAGEGPLGPHAGEGPHGEGAAGHEAGRAAAADRSGAHGGRTLSVRVQSVLYEPDAGSLDRFLRTLAQAVAALGRSRPGVVVDVALADCSPHRVYTPEGIERARWGFTGSGTRAVYYDHLGENPGHGGAQNRLFARYGQPDVLVVVNPDTGLDPGVLVALCDRLGSDESIGIVEARQLPLEHQKDYDHATGDTSWASGAGAAIDGSLFGDLGGFDADTFFLYCDDVDLSWRARLAGRRVVYEPSAAVFHDKRLSAGGAETPSATEVYHSGLASLLLPWKYSRPDLAEAHVVDFATSPEAIHHAVADAFDDRRREGRLPSPIDPDHAVGDFSTYAYAPLRFDYAR